jgi:hypothetical protein
MRSTLFSSLLLLLSSSNPDLSQLHTSLLSSTVFPTMSMHSLLLTIVYLLLPSPANSQIGIMTQDLSTIAAYSKQLPCAQSCFMFGKSCPVDRLGRELGCEVDSNCSPRGSQAKNDCYCRADLQQPAQAFLTSCIQSSCSVGDASIDAATAGSIYSQYCAEKGYVTTGVVPAIVEATLTASDGSVHTTTRTRTSTPGPTSGSGKTSENTTSSESTGMSIETIIGIIVGSLAGLAFLAFATMIILKICRPCLKRKPTFDQHHLPLVDNKAVYPMHAYNEPYYPSPRMEDDIRPDDSCSVVGGLARPAPTLISEGGMPRRW